MINKNDPYAILISKLRAIYDSREFVDGIYSYIDTEEKCLAMLEYLDLYEDVDMSSVCLMALEINDRFS